MSDIKQTNGCPYEDKLKEAAKLKGLPADFVWPNKPSDCTWTADKEKQTATPHSVRPL